MYSGGDPISGAMGAKGAVEAAGTAAASTGATIASMVAPIAINTLVGAVTGGGRGALTGLLGGVLSQAASSMMGGIFNKPSASAPTGTETPTISQPTGPAPITPEVPKSANLSTPPVPSPSPTPGLKQQQAMGISSFSSPQLTMGDGMMSEIPDWKNTPEGRMPVPTASQSDGGFIGVMRRMKSDPAMQDLPPDMRAAILYNELEKTRADRALAQSNQNYRNQMKANVYGSATKGLMGGIGEYFNAKSEEGPSTVYQRNPNRLQRNMDEAKKRRQRQQLILNSRIPSIRRPY